MVVIRGLRAHLDAVIAVLLAMAYLIEAAIAAEPVSGEPVVTGLRVDEGVVLGTGVLFLLSLALRRRLPLLPLGLAFVALGLAGRLSLTSSWSLLAGVVLAVYSTGAWAGGRAGQVGALGVGALAGLAVVRTPGPGLEARDVAWPVFVLAGAWLLGLAVRSVRVGRGDDRLVGQLDWEAGCRRPRFGRPGRHRPRAARRHRALHERRRAPVAHRPTAAHGRAGAGAPVTGHHRSRRDRGTGGDPALDRVAALP